MVTASVDGTARLWDAANAKPIGQPMTHGNVVHSAQFSPDGQRVDETARALVLEHGADYLLTVKGNQPTVRAQIETLVTAPQGDFPPS